MENQTNCLLHKRTDCCTPIVKTSEQLIERLRHLIRIDEMNLRHKHEGEAKEKLLAEIKKNNDLLKSLLPPENH